MLDLLFTIVITMYPDRSLKIFQTSINRHFSGPGVEKSAITIFVHKNVLNLILARFCQKGKKLIPMAIFAKFKRDSPFYRTQEYLSLKPFSSSGNDERRKKFWSKYCNSGRLLSSDASLFHMLSFLHEGNILEVCDE